MEDAARGRFGLSPGGVWPDRQSLEGLVAVARLVNQAK
jgi:hypothetical protein